VGPDVAVLRRYPDLTSKDEGVEIPPLTEAHGEQWKAEVPLQSLRKLSRSKLRVAEAVTSGEARVNTPNHPGFGGRSERAPRCYPAVKERQQRMSGAPA